MLINIQHDDGFGRMLDHRMQPFLALAQRRLGLAACGDIPEDRLRSNDVTRLGVDHCLPHFEEPPLAVDHIFFDVLERLFGLHQFQVVAAVLVRQFGREQIVVGLAHEFFASESGQFAEQAVDERDPPVDILANHEYR